MSSTQACMIDDSDPRLTYYGDWFTSSQNSAIAYNSTWRGTNKSASSVSFTFYGWCTFSLKPIDVADIGDYTYTGTEIAVYGTVDAFLGILWTPGSIYQIDTQQAFKYEAPVSLLPAYQQQFYSSPDLPLGQHTLVITATQDYARFWLDYMTYTTVPQSAINCSIAPRDPVDGASTGVSYTATSTITTPPTTTSSTQAQRRHATTKSASAWLVAGGACSILLLMISITIVVWHKRRRGGRQHLLSTVASNNQRAPDLHLDHFRPRATLRLTSPPPIDAKQQGIFIPKISRSILDPFRRRASSEIAVSSSIPSRASNALPSVSENAIKGHVGHS